MFASSHNAMRLGYFDTNRSLSYFAIKFSESFLDEIVLELLRLRWL